MKWSSKIEIVPTTPRRERSYGVWRYTGGQNEQRRSCSHALRNFNPSYVVVLFLTLIVLVDDREQNFFKHGTQRAEATAECLFVVRRTMSKVLFI